MTSISDKLSASVRKAKAQSTDEKATNVPQQAVSKAPVKASSPTVRTKQQASAKKSTASSAAKQASENELFPTRVWPD